MRISEQTLEFLVGLISGANGLSSQRSEPELADFFDNRTEWEPFGHGFPPKMDYVRERLGLFNGSPRLRIFIERAFVAEDEGALWPDNAALRFSELLIRDGYRMLKVRKPAMPNSGTVISPRYAWVVEKLVP